MHVNKGHIQVSLNRVSEGEVTYHSVGNSCPQGDPNIRAALSGRTGSKLGGAS